MYITTTASKTVILWPQRLSLCHPLDSSVCLSLLSLAPRNLWSVLPLSNGVISRLLNKKNTSCDIRLVFFIKHRMLRIISEHLYLYLYLYLFLYPSFLFVAGTVVVKTWTYMFIRSTINMHLFFSCLGLDGSGFRILPLRRGSLCIHGQIRGVVDC